MPRSGLRPSTQATYLGLLANGLWGTSFLAGQYSVKLGGPIIGTVLAFAIALPVLFISTRISGRSVTFPRGPAARAACLSVGVTGFGLFYPFLYAGLGLLSSGRSAAILLSAPLFALVLALLFLRERATWRRGLAVTLGIVGCAILIFSNAQPSATTAPASLQGDFFTLAAALSLAASVIFTRKYADAIDLYNLTFWSAITGLVMLIPAAAYQQCTGAENLSFSLAPMLAVLYGGAVCTALCCLVWNRAITLVPVRVVAPTMYIKTPVAILLGTLLVHESLTLALILGSALVMFGVWVSESGAPNG